MRRGALKIKTVACLEAIFFILHRDRQCTAQYIKELFAFMGVRIAAARAWGHAKQMRLHHCVSPSQQLHANSRASLQNLSLRWLHLPAARSRCIEEIQDVRFVKSCKLAQSSH